MRFCLITDRTPSSKKQSGSSTPYNPDFGGTWFSTQLGQCRLISDAELTDDDIAVFDGHILHPSFAGSSTHNCRLVQLCRPAVPTLSHITEILGSCAGIFCVLQFDKAAGSIFINLDPLSQYCLFVSEKGNKTYIGNDLLLMEHILQHDGHKTHRTIRSVICEAVFGLGMGNETGVSELGLSPFGQNIAVNARTGVATYINGPLFDTAEHVNQSVEDIATDFQKSISRIVDTYGVENTCFDLTGGVDSRLVCAAVQSAEIQKARIFYSETPPRDHPDRWIPQVVANKFGLVFAPFPQNYDGERLTNSDLLARSAAGSAGITLLYSIEVGRIRLKDIARVRGGVGEILRDYYTLPTGTLSPFSWIKSLFRKRHKALLWARLKSAFKHLGNFTGFQTVDRFLIRQLRSKNNPAATLLAELKQQAYAVSLRQLLPLLEQGFSEDDLPSLFYLMNRSRRHFGYNSILYNRIRPTFEPLANIHLWRLSSRFTHQERRNGDIVEKLLKSLCPALLTIPCSTGLDCFKAVQHKTLDDYRPIADLERAAFKLVPDPVLINDSKAYQDFAALVNELDHPKSSESFLDLRVMKDKVNDAAFSETYANNQMTFDRLHRGLIWLLKREQKIELKDLD